MSGPEPRHQDLPWAASNRRAIRATWQGWPGGPVVYLLRPALLAVALIVAMTEVRSAHGIEVALMAAGVAVIVRSFRLPPVELALALALSQVGIALAVVIASRAIATQLGIWSHPGGWKGGLERVRRTRRQLVEPRTVEELRGEPLALSDTSYDRALKIVLAGWATADLSRQAGAMLLAVRLLVGREKVSGGDQGFEVLRPIFARSFVIQLVANASLLAITTAAVLHFLYVPPMPWPLSSLPLPATVVGVVVVSWWAVRSRPTPKVFTLVIVSLVAWWSGMLPVLAAGIGCGVLSVLIRSAVDRTSIARRGGRARRGLPLRRRANWRAARSAAETGRHTVATSILESIIADAGPASAQAATAAVWVAELDRRGGRLATALDRLDAAVDVAGKGAARDIVLLGRAECCVELGLASRALADLAARSDKEDPRSQTIRAQALALLGRVGEAMALVEQRQRGATVADILRVETVVARVRLLAWDDAEEISDRLAGLLDLAAHAEEYEGVDIDRSGDVLAPAWLTLGVSRFRARADASSVAGPLRRALRGDLDPRDSAVAQVLLAATSLDVSSTKNQEEQRVDLATTALVQLEEARLQLRSGSARAGVLRMDGVAHQAVLDLLSHSSETGTKPAQLADFVMESRRRSALSDLIRSPVLGEFPGLLEADTSTDQLKIFDHEREAGLRARLEESFDRIVADAYVPPRVDPRAGPGQLQTPTLSFAVHRLDAQALQAHSVYVDERGGRTVTVVTSNDERVLQVLGAHGTARTQDVYERPYTPIERERWMAVARCLLPPPLVDRLTASTPVLDLAIVPDATLSLVPWAALTLPDESRLVERCATRVVPALHLTRRVETTSGPIVAVLREDLPGFERERSWLEERGALLVVGRSAVLSALGLAPGWAYLAAHGTGADLTQRLHLSDGVITAAEALRHRWPPTVVMAACIAAGYEHRAGREPLGFAVSLLLGGATTVIGGIAKVESTSAPEILLPTLAARSGTEARSLRRAQLEHLDAIGRTASPHRWATYACITLARTIA